MHGNFSPRLSGADNGAHRRRRSGWPPPKKRFWLAKRPRPPMLALRVANASAYLKTMHLEIMQKQSYPGVYSTFFSVIHLDRPPRVSDQESSDDKGSGRYFRSHWRSGIQPTYVENGTSPPIHVFNFQNFINCHQTAWLLFMSIL